MGDKSKKKSPFKKSAAPKGSAYTYSGLVLFKVSTAYWVIPLYKYILNTATFFSRLIVFPIFFNTYVNTVLPR